MRVAPLIARNEQLLGGLVDELVREPGYEGRDPVALSAAPALDALVR